MSSFSSSRILLPLCALAALISAVPGKAQISIFSSGYLTPETISLAPNSFGSYGGEFFITDGGRATVSQSKIYTVPSTGGAPTTFASNLPGLALGGLFLPSAGWG